MEINAHRRKSFGNYLLACSGILLNPLLLHALLPLPKFEKAVPFLWCLSVLMAGLGLRGIAAKRGFMEMLRTDVVLNALLFVGVFALVLVSNRVHACDFKWLRLLAYLASLLQLLRASYLGSKAAKDRKMLARIGTVGFALMFSWLILEMVFLFVARSHGRYPEAFSNINWIHRYWGHVNALGLRERELLPKGNAKRIFALGDSFTAGSGVTCDERYSNQLQGLLGVGWEVYNFGYPGENTGAELQHLQELQTLPDVLVLGYCLNDIQNAALTEGVAYDWVPPSSRIPSVLRPLVHYSYVCNYFFGSFAYGGNTQVSFPDYLKSCYASEKVMARHRAELLAITDFAEQHGISVVAVVFPLLQGMRESMPMTKVVSGIFEDAKVPVVDMGIVLDSLLGTGVSEDALIANRTDPHPSALVHRLAAERIAVLISQMR